MTISMMSDDLIPSACEVEICATVSRHALALASGTPGALLGWNTHRHRN